MRTNVPMELFSQDTLGLIKKGEDVPTSCHLIVANSTNLEGTCWTTHLDRSQQSHLDKSCAVRNICKIVLRGNLAQVTPSPTHHALAGGPWLAPSVGA